MDFIQQHKIIVSSVLLIGLLTVLVASQVLLLLFWGETVPAPTIPRQESTQGAGEPLQYVVLGDSTAVAQGADYTKGVAVGTQQILSKDYKVTMTNFGESGARVADVANKQVSQIKDKPDVALVLVGSNDVNHLTSKASIKRSLLQTIDQLTTLNCDVKIVVTGAAQMGAVARFPQPVRWLAGSRTQHVNQIFEAVSKEREVTFARLAEKTGDSFKNNPQLFAADMFHPNAQGYAVWTPVLADSINEALMNQVSHCKKD